MAEVAQKPLSKLAQKLLAMQRASDEEYEAAMQQKTTVAATPPVFTNGHPAAPPPDPHARCMRVAHIEVREQARVHFENIETLAQNIDAFGQVHPIVVCELGPDRYLLKHGERRLRAIRDVLKREVIFATVLDADPDSIDWELAQLSENIQREDYKPLDIARRLQLLLDRHQWNAATLADKLHISKSWVSRRLSLLEAPVQVQLAIEEGTLPETDYYNNKQRYKNGLAGNDLPAYGRGPSRTAMVRLPLTTAVQLAQMARALAAHAQLAPIDLSRRPTKKELQAIFESRTPELWKYLSELDERPASP